MWSLNVLLLRRSRSKKYHGTLLVPSPPACDPTNAELANKPTKNERIQRRRTRIQTEMGCASGIMRLGYADVCLRPATATDVQS